MTLICRGILYQNQKKYNFAIESFKNALNFRPNLAGITFKYYYVCRCINEKFMWALVAPFPVAYLNLGISLIALGKCQEAAQVLQDGSRLNGTGVRDRNSHENARISSYLQLGALYADQGKLQRALAVYREALHELPHNYHMRDVLYYRIGDIFGRLQKWDEAEKHHRAALNLRPKEAGVHLSYGITLARNVSVLLLEKLILLFFFSFCLLCVLLLLYWRIVQRYSGFVTCSSIAGISNICLVTNWSLNLSVTNLLLC